MKKILIILTAALAFALVAENVLAQGWRNRGGIGFLAAPEKAENQGGRSGPSNTNPGTGVKPPGDLPGDTVKVYRRTPCGEYRHIGYVNADNLDVPGDDYVLVRRCGHYYWMQIVQ
jgi:hypothetical protein